MIAGTIAVVNRGCIDPALTAWLWRTAKWAPGVNLVLPDGEGGEITRGRNAGAEQLHGDFLLCVDSDCIPPDGALGQVLSYGLPLVGGLCMERGQDELVCATRTFEPTTRWALEDLPESGVIPVLAVGTGFLLIRRPVLEALGAPIFRCGQLVLDALTEDTDFCLRAAEAGFPPYLDCGLRVGHRMVGLLWAHDDGQQWIQWEASVYREPLNALVAA